MRKFLGRAAASAAVAAFAVIPLAGVAAAQAPSGATQSAAPSDCGWWHGQWVCGPHGGWHHDHDLLDVDLGIDLL
ncbi:hypothetical protein [Streptomyces sp. NPDC055749]